MQHHVFPVAPTPRAAEAIIWQIEQASDSGNRAEFCTEVNGVEWAFEARFHTDWCNAGGHYFNRDEYAECTLRGAWSHDEDGNVDFCGNRAELVALIGEDAVSGWEFEQAGREME